MFSLLAVLLIPVYPDAASIDLCRDGQDLYGKRMFSIPVVSLAYNIFFSISVYMLWSTFKQTLTAFFHVLINLSFTLILLCVTYAVQKMQFKSRKIRILIVACAAREKLTLVCFSPV